MVDLSLSLSYTCDRRFLPVDKISSCEKKYLHMTGNFLLWLETTSGDRQFSCDMKFLTQISLCERIILLMARNFCNISSFWCKVSTKLHDFWSHIKISWFLFKTLSESSNFLVRFLTPCPLKSHSVALKLFLGLRKPYRLRLTPGLSCLTH